MEIDMKELEEIKKKENDIEELMLLLASEAATYIFLILSLNKMMINVENCYSNEGLMTGRCILSV
jgi:hypothetical protein